MVPAAGPAGVPSAPTPPGHPGVRAPDLPARHGGKAITHWELSQRALAAVGLVGRPNAMRVLSAYTHLVVSCRGTPARAESGRAAETTVIVKFWRNEWKQPLDAFAHRLAAACVPVPEVLGWGRVPAPATMALTPRFTVQKGEPVAFTVYRALEDARPAAEYEPHWDVATRERAYRQAGEWLRRLHGLRSFERSGPLARFPDGWQGTAEDWCGYFSEQIERWDRELRQHEIPRAHRRLRRRVRDWFLDRLSVVAPVERFVLCHRDFSFRNLLADRDGRLLALIDFEHAIAGDPVFDWHRVAAWLLCHRRDTGAWQAFRQGYGTVTGDTGDERLLVYLAFYAVSGFGYALREGDDAFYQQSVELLAWVGAQIG